jgi:hypothetical protein
MTKARFQSSLGCWPPRPVSSRVGRSRASGPPERRQKLERLQTRPQTLLQTQPRHAKPRCAPSAVDRGSTLALRTALLHGRRTLRRRCGGGFSDRRAWSAINPASPARPARRSTCSSTPTPAATWRSSTRTKGAVAPRVLVAPTRAATSAGLRRAVGARCRAREERFPSGPTPSPES